MESGLTRDECFAQADLAKIGMRATLHAMELPYWEKEAENLFSVEPDPAKEIPARILIAISPDSMNTLLVSDLPFHVPDDKIMNAAVAVWRTNERLSFGCFSLDLLRGVVQLRMDSTFAYLIAPPDQTELFCQFVQTMRRCFEPIRLYTLGQIDLAALDGML